MTLPGKRQDTAKIAPLAIVTDSDEKYPDRYVIPEREIWECVGNQRIKDLDTIDAAMRAIQEATRAILQGEGRAPHLQRIQQVAHQNNDTSYQLMMRAILAAVWEGETEGLKAAHRTAIRVMEMATTLPLWPAQADDVERLDRRTLGPAIDENTTR